MKLSEKQIDALILMSQEGDSEAFGGLYDFYLTDIYRFIFYKVTHKELAEDLTEDTFFKAWRQINKYQKTKFPFTSWLYKIAHNTVIDHVRKENVQIDELVHEITDNRIAADKTTEAFFNQQLLQRALVALPETQREVVVLKYVNERTHKEISEITGKSEAAVRTLLSRGIARLKESIQRLEEKNNL
ncbi:hypothetical protein COB57_03755 [Candidatus Peregrinibacteria bacterium]|nr:MAG: hypothetical protein COB57_03755 [Candidatus Peregrinibacteria bacterium]